MKTFKLVIVGLLLFFAVSVQAQISVRVNLGVPPQWGPEGYSDVRYYYLPDVEAYYDVPSSMFIYYNGVSWIHRSSLPSRYRNYDLYNGYKIPMSDYRGRTPYSNFRQHKMQYARGYRGQEQHNIGQRPEQGNDNQRNFSKERSNQKFDKGNNRSNDRSNDKNKGNGQRRGKGNSRDN
jgi:hypothetical protein